MDNSYCGFGDWGPCGGVDALAMTGGTDLGGWVAVGLFAVGIGLLVWYNAAKKKEDGR